MDERLPYPNRHPGIPLWVLSAATVVFASGAIFIVLWSPRALMLALACGVLAVVARSLFVRVRDAVPAPAARAPVAEAASTVSSAGLVIAAVVIAPLLAFALLWTALLAILGGTWLLHLVGLA